MKKVFFILIILCSFKVVKAQTDYCKDITSENKPTASTIGYTSPVQNNICVRTDLDKESSFKVSTIFFSTADKNADYSAYGMYAIFTDGTIWKDEGRKIYCSFTSVSKGYSYIGARIIRKQDFDIFETKKIKSIKIGTIELQISDELATKFMAYVKCIDDIKPNPDKKQ